MRRICRAPEMPDRITVIRWMQGRPDFAEKIGFAGQMQADCMDDMIRELIDTITPEGANADKVRLAALQWRASKLAPKKYGDKIEQRHTGSEERGVKVRPFAKQMGVSGTGLYEAIKRGEVEVFRMGRAVRVTPRAARRLLGLEQVV